MNELVSVVITCFNLERYIAQAIESVLRQDYSGRTEIIVVDDCSTDSSAEVIRRYPQVQYLRTASNCGVLLATVAGVEASSGDIVFFLDGDDLWSPGKLQALVPRFRSDPDLALLTHDLHFIDSEGMPIERDSRPCQVLGRLEPGSVDAAVRDAILLHGDYVWLGSAYAVRRRAAAISEFCEFARSLPDPGNTYQDWPLAFWVAAQPHAKLGYVPGKLFSYRLHGANHSGDARSAAKAVRNVRRSRNTMEAMERIALKYRLPRCVVRTTRAKLAYYAYLEDLYSGRRWQAAKGLLGGFPYIARTRSASRELARFVACQVLGFEGFIRASARRQH
jgi:glycosyltransferase involved in cell wall biosynthesis